MLEYLDHREDQGMMLHQGSQGRKDRRVLQESQDYLDYRASLVSRLKASLLFKDSLDHLATLALRAHQDLKESPVRMDYRDYRDPKVYPGQADRLAMMGSLAWTAPLDCLGLLGNLEFVLNTVPSMEAFSSRTELDVGNCLAIIDDSALWSLKQKPAKRI